MKLLINKIQINRKNVDIHINYKKFEFNYHNILI